MIKQSLKNTLLINAGAFFLVFILEILSGWVFKDDFDTTFSFYLWGLNYAAMIMASIGLNHYVLIPYLLDKKKYIVYGLLLIGSVFSIALLKAFPNWTGVSKVFFFLIYTTGAGMAAFFLSRYLTIQRNNEEKDKLQKELELNYLKEQVNPHFLFNSLNSIYSLSRQQSPETPDLVMQLSELMRYQLESSKKDNVPLNEELEFIENYLLLEEKRLSKRCNIEFLISGETKDLNIAPMLLIPFVENAIKHGAKSTNKLSSIDISVSIQDYSLRFNIVNSKPPVRVESKRKGMGLENATRRLNLLYPNSHSLEIDNMDNEYQVSLSIDLTNSLLKA